MGMVPGKGDPARYWSPKKKLARAKTDPSLADNSESASPPPAPEEPEHTQFDRKFFVALLKSGVTAWNAWRAEHPDVIPRLRGLDFTDAALWSGTSIWGRPDGWEDEPERAILEGINFSSVRLRDANLSGAYLPDADLRRARLRGANLSGAFLLRARMRRARLQFADLSGACLDRARMRGAELFGADLSRADMSRARLENADLDSTAMEGATLRNARMRGATLTDGSLENAWLRGTDLENADLSGADLSAADISDANVTGADLRSTKWHRVRMRNIRFRARKLRGKCFGVAGIWDTNGDEDFKSAVIDQAYVDEKFDRLFRQFPFHETELDGPLDYVKKLLMAPIVAALDGFLDVISVAFCALLVGAAAWIVGVHSGPPVPLFHRISSEPIIAYALAGAIAGGMLSSWYGRRVRLELWSLFDYGRSWRAVVVFAFLCIAVIGAIYSYQDGSDIVFRVASVPCSGVGHCPDAIAVERVIGSISYPWYVALMGFCTLGITDLAAPKTGAGEIVIMLNVLCGFATLGLLVAVLADRFSRRR